MGCLFSKKYIN